MQYKQFEDICDQLCGKDKETLIRCSELSEFPEIVDYETVRRCIISNMHLIEGIDQSSNNKKLQQFKD